MKIKNNISISLSTFYKLIPNNIIKSKKQTDMCNIYNLKKSLEMKKKDLSIKKLPLPKSIKENLESIDLHEKFYKHQNKEYIID